MTSGSSPRTPALSSPPRPTWPEKKSGTPANASPPRWTAPNTSRPMFATRRSPVRRSPIRPCMSIRTRPSPSVSVSGRFSVTSSPAVVPATAIDLIMGEFTVSFRQLGTTSKHFARRLATIGENRLELLAVEVQEERERLLHAFLLSLGMAAFGLLAGTALSAAIVVMFYAWGVAVLLALTVLYSVAGVCLYLRLTG